MTHPAQVSLSSHARDPGLRSFALLSLLVTIVVTTAIVVVTSWLLSGELLQKDSDLARQAAMFLRDQIREHTDDLGLTPLSSREAQPSIRYVVDRFIRERKVAEVNLIDDRGRVFFSSENGREGRIVVSQEILARIFKDGLFAQLIPEHTVTDSERETTSGPLFESYVYVGDDLITGETPSPLIIELYESAHRYVAELHRTRLFVLAISCVAFLAMFVTHLGLFRRNSRMLADRTRELEELSSSLEQRVQEKSRELGEAQRLADLGRLAANVAHEVNTPLTSIAACAEGLQRRDDDLALRGRYLEIIRKEAFRAQGITRDLLDLARLSTPLDRVEIPIAQILNELREAHAAEPRAARVTWSLDVNPPDLSLITHPSYLRRILTNFVSNALDAIADAGTITLFAHTTEKTTTIGCRDNGVGIPPEALPRITEEFFTTKAAGRGTGLGLALAQMLSSKLGGKMRIKSAGVGRGAEAAVELPTSPSDSA